MTYPDTTRGVGESLVAVFGSNPHAVVFFANCRGEQGPFVQAGIAEFLGSSREHRFRLAADLGPAFAGSGVGIVYAGPVATEVERTLAEVDRSFSRKLDPLRLLAREEELMDAVRKLHQQASETTERSEHAVVEGEERHKRRDAQLKNKIARLEARIANLETHNAELRSRFSSRRYRLADALAERALRVSVLRKLVRRRDIPPSD